MGADDGLSCSRADAVGRIGEREAQNEATVVACGLTLGQLVVGAALLFSSSATQIYSFAAPWWWGWRVQGMLVVPW